MTSLGLGPAAVTDGQQTAAPEELPNTVPEQGASLASGDISLPMWI